MSNWHIPVLVNEVVDYLKLKKGMVVVDGTLGHGGHTKAILEVMAKTGRVIGIDKDADNLKRAQLRLKKYSDRVKLISGGFENMVELILGMGIKRVDAVILDLGLSASHLDEAEKGFAYQKSGPLDMRFSQNQDKKSAADIINSASKKELVFIFRKYGELERATRLADLIIRERVTRPFKTTDDLLRVVEEVFPVKKMRRHPAAQVFQAIRIAVNQELEVLGQGLEAAVKILKPSGRIIIISYHSLEDRIVKNFFKKKAQFCICPPEFPHCVCSCMPQLKIITKKPIRPTAEEIKKNIKSRSAKMRVAEKIS